MALSADKAREQNQGLKGANFYEWKEKNYLRFLTLPQDDESWCVPYAQHFLKVSETQILALYCSTFSPFHEKKCMVCEIMKKGKAFLKKKDLDSLYPTKRGLALAVDIKELKLGVQMVRVPISVVKKLNVLVTNQYDFADLDTGAGVIVDKVGSGMNTEYSVSPYKQGLSLPIDELGDREKIEADMGEMDPEEWIKADDAEAKAEFAKSIIQWRPELKPAVPQALLTGGGFDGTGEEDGEEGTTHDAEYEEKPHCFGDEWVDGDPDCEACPDEMKCKAAWQKAHQKPAKGKPIKGKPEKKKPVKQSGKSRLAALM